MIPTRSLRPREVPLELLYRVKGQHSYRARIVRDPNNLECTEDQALCFFRISAPVGCSYGQPESHSVAGVHAERGPLKA